MFVAEDVQCHSVAATGLPDLHHLLAGGRGMLQHRFVYPPQEGDVGCRSSIYKYKTYVMTQCDIEGIKKSPFCLKGGKRGIDN